MLRWPFASFTRPFDDLRRRVQPTAWSLLLGLLAGGVHAQVVVNEVAFPVNVGRTLEVTVNIEYTRLTAAAAVIRTPIPTPLSVDPPVPPAGCSVITIAGGPVVECIVPDGGPGAGGFLSFPVRGNILGSFSLVATATGGSSASNTGNVRSSGDLTVLKSLAPASPLLTGQSTTFTLRPQLAAGADDLPAGASLTVTDQLPGTTTDFQVSAISAGISSCNPVADANAMRTVSCTLTGPLSAAAINAAVITVTGAPGTTGNFTNVGSVATGSGLYVDRDPNNNTANVNYTVNPGSDVQALGSFPSSGQLGGSAQTLTLSSRNNGPSDLPAGGTVRTSIPAGFTVTSLPAGCSGPAVGVVLALAADLECTLGAAAVGSTTSFAVPLSMPASGAGNFTVTAAPPAGFGDSVAGNNSVTLPWQVVAPFANLRLAKAKSPASGPIVPGSVVTTTLTVTNSATSPSAAVYSANGGGTELRVIDWMRPQEISGDVVSNVSPGWTCSVVVVPAGDPLDATRTRRVDCVRTAGGSLAPDASLAVSFSTTVASVVAPVTLPNRACTGATLLAELGLTAAASPQPPATGAAGTDCASAGSSLTATTVGSGQAAVTLRKESSVDGTTWFDAAAAAPTLGANAGTQFWRLTITTPAAAPQAVIPTLTLNDPLPGILNVASPGAPVPAYQTPAITPVVSPGAAGSCPAVAAGSNTLACSFSNVAPGSSIVISYAVARPFASGTLLNTATLASPDAVLSGTLSDDAAIVVEPRIDVAATTKTVTPGTPRIGQSLQFTITAQNLGPDNVAGIGDFKIVDDLNTSVAGAAVAFADIVAAGAGMSCSVANTALADEAALAANHVRVRCTNTAAVARYSTRTVTITARVLKPAVLPGAGNVYVGQTNTARVDLPDALCEFRNEGSVSLTCNDANSTSNNTQSVSFNVALPQVNLMQQKERVLPAGQNRFGIGQPLRYRFRLQNSGLSRAEGVTMTDLLTLPPGFTLTAPRVLNVNGAAAGATFTLDNSKNASVSCTQPTPTTLVCVLAATTAASYLDPGREVNFEVELTQTGSSLVPVSFGNQALVCSDESSAGFESTGSCDRNAAGNDNVAAVNDLIFPQTDLSLSKSTVTTGRVGLNQPVEFRLQAQNLGPSPLQQIRISDSLPPGFELIATGANAPSLTLGSGVTLAPSTATGASLNCSASPAVLSIAGQAQTVTCVIDALPGPLGAGAFPGNGSADNLLSLRLFARPRAGVFVGPWLSNLNNVASISPGVAGDGNPLSIDTVAGNNTSSSVVQVARSSLEGRVFLDRNGNGSQDGTAVAEDAGIGGVTITLLGTDAFGNAIARTTLTDASAGPTRGDYRFDDLPPGNYTLIETQPTDHLNSAGQPTLPLAGGRYTAAASVVTSSWSDIALPLGVAAGGYLFPESLAVGTVSGRVFNDRNDNARLELSDGGITGVTLGLYPAGTVCPAAGALPGGSLQTSLSDSNGNYSFRGVPVGSSYVICQLQPPGHADRPPLPRGGGVTPGPNQINIGPLTAAGSADNDFPEVLGFISGQVFFDPDNNGVPGPGEPGIGSATSGAGVPITLTGAAAAGPAAGVPITRTTTTAADGSWRFDDLLPGTYTVTEGAIPLLLGTYVDGINSAGPVTVGAPGTAGVVGDNAIRNIVLTGSGASSVDNRFAERPRAAIWGLVFVDGNGDRVLTSFDTQRLSGVVIELRQGGTSCADAGLLGTTTTAADGSWVFPGGSVLDAQVVAGQDYRVCQRQPVAYDDGPTLPGDHAVSTLANQILVTALPAAGSGNNLFGEWPRPPSDVRNTTISGTVFIDRNRDGQLTVADPGRITSVTVRLVDGPSCSGNEIGRVSTDSNGRYSFPGGTVRAEQVPSGNRYSVCQDQPVDYADGGTRAGTGGTSPAPNHILIASLPSTGSTDNDFGEFGASVSAIVYLDADGNGQRGASDGGIGGVLITLSGEGGAGTRQAFTAADGRVSFDDLPAGRWTLTEQTEQPVVTLDGRSQTTIDARTTPGTGGGTATPPGSLPSRISDLNVPPGGSAVDNLFGETLGAGLSGRVWLDANGDGRLDAGEAGIAGVSLVLTGTDDLGRPVNLSTVTAADGSYAFASLRPGQYTLTEPTQPVGTGNGVTVAGSAGGFATPVGTQPSAISSIVLVAGQRSVDNNFGETRGGPGLVVSKSALEARFVVGQPARYRIQLRNVGSAPTVSVYTVSDRLPAGLTLAATPTGSGWTCNGAAGASAFSCSSSQVIAPDSLGASMIELSVQVGEAAAAASPASNAVLVDGGGEPADRAPSADERDRFDNRPGSLPLCAPLPLHNACRSETEVLRSASLAGRVWLDDNGNGRVDGSEAGIAGVTVVLTGTDDLGQPVRLTQTTGPDGRYLFSGLRPGSYTVTEPTQPPGTGNGSTLPGTTGGTATAIGTTPSAISGIPLLAGQRSDDNNFGETPAAPDLVVGKTAREARFLVGRSGHYTIQVRNVGSAATRGSTNVTDRLPAGLTLAALPAGSGWTCSGAAGAGSFSCSSDQVLAAGASATAIELTVLVADAAADASPVSNAVLVDGGGEPGDRTPSADERERFTNQPTTLPVCVAPAAHNGCRSVTEVQRTASLSGTVWLELGPNPRQLDSADRRLQGWIVELVDPDSGRVIATTITGPDGRYRFTDLEPGVPLGVRFRDPSSGVVVGNPVNGETGSPAAVCNASAVPSSCSDNRHGPLLRVVLAPGQELGGQSLPVVPTGVVYDPVTRDPVPGAVVTLGPVGSCPGWDPASQVAAATLGGYTVVGNSLLLRTGSNGFYHFVLLPTAPAHCLFGLTLQPPPGWVFPSTIIPAQPQPLAPTGPAGTVVQVQPQPLPPTGEVGPATPYHLLLDIGSGTPTVVHNHIPVDPDTPAGLLLRKTADRAVVELGDSLRYSIVVRLTAGTAPRQVTVADRLPAGFTYIPGTAMVEGRRIADPVGAPGPRLAFHLGGLPASGSATLQYRVRVGVGAQRGDGINHAVAYACNLAGGCTQPGGIDPLAAARASNDDRHRVRVAGGAFALEACVLGKVFVDCNGNHVQDREELGIPGVRLVLQDGTFLTSDSEGKYSVCGLPPRSHVLRIDELTLPRGTRLTTSSNRNLGDAGSLWLDLQHGGLQRGDFIEGSCSNTVLDQVKARQAQGEVSVPQVEKAGRPALRFDSKSQGRNALTTPTQGTDGANQQLPRERAPSGTGGPALDDRHVPTPELPMNRPPPPARRSSDAPAAPATPDVGGSHGSR